MAGLKHDTVGTSLTQAEWEATNSHSGNTMPTLVVAASNAKTPKLADYECDGTADDVQIQAAIDALPAGGGRVVLTEGTFNITAKIVISSADITLAGAGRDATLLYLVTGSNADMMAVSGTRTTLCDFVLNGNSTGQSSGNGLNITGASSLTLSRLNIKSVKQNGLYCNNTSDLTIFWLTDVFIFTTGAHGAYLRHMAGIMAKGIIISSADTTGHGYDNLYLWQSLENSFTSCLFDVSGRYGIAIVDSHKNTITDSYVGGSYATGIIMWGDYYASSNSEGNILMGNTLNGNGVGGTAYSDIYIGPTTACTGLIIAHNQLSHWDNRAGQGIELVGNVNKAIIEGNTLVPNEGSAVYLTPIKVASFTGTGTIISNNAGYVTENQGTDSITSGQTTKAVTHGLAATPTVINITFAEQGTADYGRWWISTIGATTFTLNVSVDPGVSNLDFWWEAKVR